MSSDGHADFLQNMYRRLEGWLNPEQCATIAASENPIVTLAIFLTRLQCQKVTVSGVENIPENESVIVALNHPFNRADTRAFFAAFAKMLEARPWKFMAHVGFYSKYFPGWEQNAGFKEHLIPVHRTGGPDGGKPVNSSGVLSEAVDFLTQNRNALLLMCPEGGRSTFLRNIQEPYSGFARIAHAARVPISPVLVSGSAEMDQGRFSIKETVLRPLFPVRVKPPEETARAWKTALVQALKNGGME